MIPKYILKVIIKTPIGVTITDEGTAIGYFRFDDDVNDIDQCTYFPVVREYNQLLVNKLGNLNRLGNPDELGNPIRLLDDVDCGVFIEVDIAATGATNSLIITDDVDAADPSLGSYSDLQIQKFVLKLHETAIVNT